MLKLIDLRPRATGDTWPIDFDLVGSDAVPLATAAEFVYELSVNAEENPADPAATNLFTLEGSVTDSKLTFTPSNVQAALLVVLPDQAAYWFDVKVTNGAGRVGTLAKGRLPITGPITP